MKRRALTTHHSLPILIGMGVFLFASIFSILPPRHRVQATEQIELSSHSISLANRYGNSMVNEVMKKNILLAIAYKRGITHKGDIVDWNKVESPFEYEFALSPGEVFTFNDDVLPEYKQKRVQTINAHFGLEEGFLSDGYLAGDGVCHLASLMYWVGKDAGLRVKAPTAHDFAQIPEISPENGVSIYYEPGNYESNALQNLYIENSLSQEVKLKFELKSENLSFLILK